MVKLTGLPSFVEAIIKKNLTYDNPKYLQAVAKGQWVNCDKFIYYYRVKGDAIFVPRGYLNRLLYLLESYRYNASNVQIEDQTTKRKFSKHIKFTSTDREYQKEALTKILKKRYGILEASTGAGKTFISIHYAVERGLKTLIIVHSKDLAQQWKQEILQHTNQRGVGMIGGGEYVIRDFTVCIINSLYNKMKDPDYAKVIRKEFGTVILDETHRAISPSWVYCINRLNPKFQLGLSATPFRADNLTGALYHNVGPKLYTVPRDTLQSIKAVLIPRIIRRQTGFCFNYRGSYSKMISYLVSNRYRNDMIIKDVIYDIQTYNETVILVSDRVGHCQYLYNVLSRNRAVRPIMLTGKSNKQEREQGIQAIKKGNSNCLISTTKLLGEGFDAPALSALFLVVPIKFSGKLIQVVGRLLRPKGNAVPRVYDYRDNRVSMLRVSGYHRDRIYKNYGWDDSF